MKGFTGSSRSMMVEETRINWEIFLSLTQKLFFVMEIGNMIFSCLSQKYIMIDCPTRIQNGISWENSRIVNGCFITGFTVRDYGRYQRQSDTDVGCRLLTFFPFLLRPHAGFPVFIIKKGTQWITNSTEYRYGADEEIRTPNQRIRSAVLYPLSYIRLFRTVPYYYTQNPGSCKGLVPIV